MKQVIDPKDIHTAIDTWSGFVYQGKVALYHVLTLLIENPDNESFLQLDSLEDFAIVNEDITPISLHQVKAVNSKYYSSFKKAFIKLEKRKNEYPCDRAYFHLAIENEKSANDINKKHPNLELYMYRDNNYYCSLNDINEKLEALIRSYLVQKEFGHFVGNTAIIRSKLEKKLFDHVILVHSSNHNKVSISKGAYYQIIKISDFRTILEEDPSMGLNEDYYSFLTKELLNRYYNEFCFELEEGAIVKDSDKEKLDGYIKQINVLSDKGLITFIKSILPHRKVKYESITDFKDHNIQKNEFKLAYLKSLHHLVVSKTGIVDGLIWNDSDNKQYRATAINEGESSLEEICKDIYNNVINTDLGTLYQTDFLITSDLEGSIETTINKQFSVEGKEDRNNVNKWSNIHLIKREVAKAKING
ncbi:hypothetical protein JMN32_19595 [Fulvivirga sp. 29W222]|uniref:ABC-three component systems C-terminal domain-containing protein n=1 Tax=Fulvivirga marina TaxID=2494733 RepID=A0A937FYJ9_9BACT|nr:ABC-three component system protein [Fulvivirga marina]MBL6448524.1 hypothetical protein [Fulvivirga marina]